MLDVCLLGCGGMLPLPKRFLTSLIVRQEGRNLLIDCGESTQVALHLCGWSVKQIDDILITHFHGDHVTGLPGLLMTMGNNGRTEPVTIHGGVGLAKIVEGLTIVCPQLPFKLEYHEISPPEQFKVGNLEVSTISVEHRVPCLAYSLYLPRIGKFDVQKAKELGIPLQYWSILQKRGQIEVDARTYYAEEVLGEARKGLRLTYATDCRPSDDLVDLAMNSDLLVAEGLYGEAEKLENAAEKGHMVFVEAAQIAKDSKSRELWLTHYSPAMTNPQEYLSVATKVFANSKCGENLMQTTLYFE